MPVGETVRRFRRKLARRQQRNFRTGVWSEVAGGLRGQLYVERDHRVSDTVFLAGHGRSGTTWIAEVVNHDGAYRSIHEPFHPGRLDATGGFRPRLYLRPEERDPTYLRPAEAVLSGRVRSLWGDKFNRAVLPRKRLIKEVRANLLLPWMHRQFPEMPIVFVLRHPCAVMSSQRKLAGSWEVDLARFLDQPALVEDYLEPFVDEIARAESEFERRVFVWCIDNYVPLRHFRPGDIHVTFYERCCVDPRAELGRLFALLGKPFGEDVLAHLRDPSATSRTDSAIVTGEDLVNSWRRHVSDEELRRTVEILELFGLDRIYGEDSMPNLQDASEALG
ncbi:MAG: sulfotransferase [Actinomycetota bacterium]